MTTARDIVTKALQKNGVLTKDDAPAADEANDGFYALNALLSSWSNDSIVIYARTLEEFTLATNQATYTMGPGGDFDTVRPMNIVEMHVRISTLDYDLDPLTDEAYQQIGLKSQSGIPTYFNYTNGYSLSQFNIWPIPAANWPVFILSEKPLVTFATLDTQVLLPPGWERALIYNLSVELAPEYGVQVDPMVMKIANDSRGQIARSVLKNRSMDADIAGQRGNIYNGWYRT